MKMSLLSYVLSHLSDQINMQDELSHEMCPHKTQVPFIRVPIMLWQLYLQVYPYSAYLDCRHQSL